MSISQVRDPGSTNRLKNISIIFSMGSCLVIAVTIWMMYAFTADLLQDRLNKRVVAVAGTIAEMLNGDEIRGFIEVGTEKYIGEPAYTKLVLKLQSVKRANKDLTFAYILAPTDEEHKMKFVADADVIALRPDLNFNVDTETDEVVVTDEGYPGSIYDMSEVAVVVDRQAFSGAVANPDVYEDAWGTLYSGYAPIKDSNGEVVAILGLDFDISDYNYLVKTTFLPFGLITVLLATLLLVLTIAFLKLWGSRVDLMRDLDRQKDELLGIVAHQLAKPITAIRWNLESLYDGDLGQLNDKQKEEAVTMRTQAVNLADLVSMILDVSRIQLGKINLEPLPLDLNAFFKEILDVIEPTVKQKKINFVKKMPSSLPTALLDKRYTRMTIENLLTNAVKYTPEGGTVTLDLKIDSGVLRCSVADTGMGIPKAEQDKIFGKMYRASNVRNTVEGNGFGLYVAKGAIEGQGGKLTFTSTEGKGTTFYCELPLKQAPEKKAS